MAPSMERRCPILQRCAASSLHSTLEAATLLALLGSWTRVCSADPIFAARAAHMTVPQGADDPSLSMEFWPIEAGVKLPPLKPGQESMTVVDGATQKQYHCIIPNITSSKLLDDDDDDFSTAQEQDDEDQSLGISGVSAAKQREHAHGWMNPGEGVREGDTRKTPEEILNVMKGLPCSYKMEGWWTYEFCYKDKIRQLHFEPAGENKLQITMEFVLGIYNEARTREAQRKYDADLAAMSAEERSEHKRYFVQVYDRGTPCDLTQEMRQTEVHFLCENKGRKSQEEEQEQQQQQQQQQANYIKSLKEAPTSHYEMQFASSLLCAHGDFRARELKPNVINCYEVPKEKSASEAAEEEGLSTDETSTSGTESQSPKGRGSAAAGDAGVSSEPSSPGGTDTDVDLVEDDEAITEEVIPEDEEVRALEEELVAL